MRVLWSGGVAVGSFLRSLRERDLNYDPREVRAPEWTFDVHRHDLGREVPGPPCDGGVWQRARPLVESYEFTPPEIVRGFYEAASELLGRDMVLQARLPAVRFLMGVRVTQVRDEVSEQHSLWGWSYQTLQGHLERGRVDYELIKHHDTGAVEFVARSHSQLHPRAPWWMRWGWRLVGRRTQLRFYRRAGQRLRLLLNDDAGPIVVTPRTVERTGRWSLTVPDPLL
ncbi:protein of unknown function (DUF1990) [Lentzea californiensis]|nr:protein of unknown function (DUF1990) [Lentzea californiensis]